MFYDSVKSRLGLGWGMMEYSLQVLILAIIFLCIFLEHLKHQELKLLFANEGDLVKENLNHIASAIIGLSELLDEADSAIENMSRVPSMGEMFQQMLQGFIVQKMQAVKPPNMADIQNKLITPENLDENHGEKTRESDNSEKAEI